MFSSKLPARVAVETCLPTLWARLNRLVRLRAISLRVQTVHLSEVTSKRHLNNNPIWMMTIVIIIITQGVRRTISNTNPSASCWFAGAQSSWLHTKNHDMGETPETLLHQSSLVWWKRCTGRHLVMRWYHRNALSTLAMNLGKGLGPKSKDLLPDNWRDHNLATNVR